MSLTCEAVTASYGDVPILRGLTCEVPPRQVTALFGPNGVGKSTLFRAILGHLAHGGTVRLDGRDLAGESSAARARRIAYVPQQTSPSFPYPTLDMVLMGRSPHVTSLLGPSLQEEERAVSALRDVGLLDCATQPFTTLSGGQRQLALLARAICQGCDYYLLDEPTASLDYRNQLIVWEAIRRLAQEGRGVFVCTHDPNHALWFCDRVTVLGRDGVLEAQGPVEEVLDADLIGRLYPGSARIAELGRMRAVLPTSVHARA